MFSHSLDPKRPFDRAERDHQPGCDVGARRGDRGGTAVGQPVTVVGRRVGAGYGSLTLAAGRIDALERAQARIGDGVSR